MPFVAMQALYLQQKICYDGLNSIIILSLYFNSVCILYSLSNFCSSKKADSNKIFQKESDRLKDYYDAQ